MTGQEDLEPFSEVSENSRRHFLEGFQLDTHHTYTLRGPVTAEARSAPAAERWAFAGRQRQLTPLLFYVAVKGKHCTHPCGDISPDSDGRQLRINCVFRILPPLACSFCHHPRVTAAAQRMGKSKGGKQGARWAQFALTLLPSSPFRVGPSRLTNRRCGFGYGFHIFYVGCCQGGT